MQDETTVDGESVSRTFRIERQVLEQLQQHAKDRRISLSALGNQIFRDFVEYYANASKAGFVVLHKEFVAELLKTRDEKDMTRIGRWDAEHGMKKLVMVYGCEQNIHSFLALLDTWLRICSIPYRRIDEGDVCTYYIQHEMNLQWSTIIAEYWKTICQNLKKPIEVDIDDRSVALRINVS